MTDLVRDNPFTERKIVKKQDEFFGRKYELMTVFARLKRFQSASIYGERKIGKSSFLYYVLSKIPEKLGGDYKSIYIDLRDPKYHTVCDFLKNVLTKLECDPKIILQNSTNINYNQKIYHQNLSAFSKSIENLDNKNKYVLIIDGFEYIIRKPDEFNNEFFDALKTLGESEQLIYVTASLISLRDLSIENKLTSTFYGIFSEIKLGEFTPDETTDFLFAKRKDVNFNEKEIKLIKEVAGNNPMHLRIACDHIFSNKGQKWNRNKIKENIETEIQHNNYKKATKKRNRKKFKKEVVKNIVKIVELTAVILKSLRR